ncbi:MAG: cupin domain-containing protein [Acidobacteriota bacterium]
MKAERKSFSKPDEVREFPGGRVALVKIAGAMVACATFQPGWKWSECVRPIANTHSCQAAHFGYQVSGTMMTRMDDGTEIECHAGDVYSLPPGHDGWVVGNEPVVFIDFQGMAEYAKKG